MRAIITVIGKDKVGIIAAVTAILAKTGSNILDINQTVMQDFFTMITLVDIENLKISFAELKEQLNTLGEEMDLSIRIQREEIFSAMHRI